MRTSRFLPVLLLPLLLLPAEIRAADSPPAGARQVVMRGARDLSDLLLAATAPAREADPPRPVAILVDVTPYTQAAAPRLKAALEAVGDSMRRLDGSWRLGPLGGKLGKAVRHPSRLTLEVDGVLAEETPEISTIRALSRTLADFSDEGGVVVYLADWRFEDDEGLEKLVERLAARRQTFTAIGSEAGFGRAWVDPFGIGVLWHPAEPYVEGVGRDPFGPADPEAPWHGSDTAYPTMPWHFGIVPWKTSFPVQLHPAADDFAGLPEDVAERLRQAAGETGGYEFPLPSGYGPYGLMRLAAATGGKYFLHSFNPSGRSDVEYDYSRVSLFPPDLRSRTEILAEARRSALAQAMHRAWELLADDCLIARTTGPLTGDGAPRAMAWSRGREPGLGWYDVGQRNYFLRHSELALERIDESIRLLAAAIAAAPAGAGAPDPEVRRRAEAALFRHTLASIRFELAAAVATAKSVPSDAWDGDMIVVLQPITYIPERRATPNAGVTPFDPEAGKQLAAAREDHFEKFGGTPFGEQIARNEVVIFRWLQVPRPDPVSGPLPGTTPAESGGRTPRTPPPAPGASGGGGAPSSGSR